jgi:hypothetical protein
MGVNLLSAGYDAQEAKNFQNELVDRVQALPGVESAAFARVGARDGARRGSPESVAAGDEARAHADGGRRLP